MKPFLFLFLICFFGRVYCEDQWKKDELKIFATAQRENLPIVAVFISAEGCPWSDIVVQEVLRKPHFINKVAGEALLWEITLGREEEDSSLRAKYGVKETPFFLLLDPKGKEFARLGYAPLDESSYAEEILGLIDGFHQVCLALETDQKTFHEEEWKNLYLRAKKFSVPFFQQVMLERGLKREKGIFFHLEKYAALIEKHKLKSKEAQTMRKKLLSRDSDNRRGAHFQLAVLDFHKTVSRLKKRDRPEKALHPLIDYVQKFKGKDAENVWKAELMMAEYLCAKGQMDAAIEHAHASLETAPDLARPNLLRTISYMEKK